VGLILGLAACGGLTPPMPGPNETPAYEAPESTPLPLVEAPEETSTAPGDPQDGYQTGDGDQAGDSDDTKYVPSVSISPSVIYTSDIASGAMSTATITIAEGVFEANEEIEIWAEVSDPDSITHPPNIDLDDDDEDADYLQTTVLSNGGLEFHLTASLSEGSFRIYISNGAITYSVALTIQ